ncbi:Formiminoglutamase [Klebsiella pneumoniae]|nr:Formiminoglutamase [Klebsiella pneumoniae]
MMLWQSYASSLWQGRDDSAEAPNALRLFQTIARAERFAPAGDARRYRAARLRL